MPPKRKYNKKNSSNNYKKKYSGNAKKKQVANLQPILETKTRTTFDQLSGNPTPVVLPAGSSVLPSGCAVMCPRAYISGFQQTLADGGIQGNKIYLKNLRQKLELDFSAYNRSIVAAQSDLTNPDHLISLQPHEWRIMAGWCSTTLADIVPNTITEANYPAEVGLQLAKSNIFGTFLEFPKKTKGINLFMNKKIVLHNKNTEIGARIVKYATPDALPTGSSALMPARDKIQYTFNWKVGPKGSGLKLSTTPGNPGTEHYINRGYIPFVVVCCKSLHAGTEHAITLPTVHSLSKIYYLDN